MPWEQVDIDEEYKEVMPETYRANVKMEDIHRTDLPGCPRHRTAGAIMQHSSWTDPDGRHNRYTSIVMCAECGTLIEIMRDPQSIADAESDDYYRR